MGRFTLAFALLVFSLVSCVERSLILPDTATQPRLAVIATVADSVRAQVLISNTVAYDVDTFRHAVSNAEVALYKNGRYETGLYYVDNDQNCGGGCGFRFSRYLSEESLSVEVGAEYHVEVQAPGYPDVRSATVVADQQLYGVILNPVVSDTAWAFGDPDYPVVYRTRIDTVTVQYEFKGDLRDEVRLELYQRNRIDSASNFWFPSPEEEVELLPDNGQPQIFTYPAFMDFSSEAKGYESRIVFDLVRYPAGFVHFRDEILKQRNSEDIAGLYAASPTPIPTNIIGGYGYFAIFERYQYSYEVE